MGCNNCPIAQEGHCDMSIPHVPGNKNIVLPKSVAQESESDACTIWNDHDLMRFLRSGSVHDKSPGHNPGFQLRYAFIRLMSGRAKGQPEDEKESCVKYFDALWFCYCTPLPTYASLR